MIIFTIFYRDYDFYIYILYSTYARGNISVNNFIYLYFIKNVSIHEHFFYLIQIKCRHFWTKFKFFFIIYIFYNFLVVIHIAMMKRFFRAKSLTSSSSLFGGKDLEENKFFRIYVYTALCPIPRPKFSCMFTLTTWSTTEARVLFEISSWKD